MFLLCECLTLKAAAWSRWPVDLWNGGEPSSMAVTNRWQVITFLELFDVYSSNARPCRRRGSAFLRHTSLFRYRVFTKPHLLSSPPSRSFILDLIRWPFFSKTLFLVGTTQKLYLLFRLTCLHYLAAICIYE